MTMLDPQFVVDLLDTYGDLFIFGALALFLACSIPQAICGGMLYDPKWDSHKEPS